MSKLAELVEPGWDSTPVAATDAVLDCALRAKASVVWIEPSPLVPDRYAISLEQAGRSIAAVTVDASVGAAMIARLAHIAGVDLSAVGPVTGVARVRGSTSERDLVLTVRTGDELRAEALFVERVAAPHLSVIKPTELAPGDHVDHYRIISQLGAGGMGTVYIVEHVALERRYALKVLHREVFAREGRSIDRFLREARAAARLRHPHIVDVFDFGYLTDGRPYSVMELLPGHSVAELLEDGPIAPERAVTIATQLADALAAAHDGGVIHADVSASNVLVLGDHAPSVRLVDFGLAELRELRVDQPPLAEVVCGTPSYVAPEMIRGLPADELSDQYAFGVLLFEMLTGKPPFVARTVHAMCRMHLQAPPPPPASPFGPLPDALVQLIARCLAKAPAARYPSMRAVMADLQQITRRLTRRGWRRWLP